MKRFEEYTRDEFVALVEAIYAPENRTDQEQDELVMRFKTIAEHPSGSDLIYWPTMVPGPYGENPNPTPQDVTNEVVRWRRDHGLPLFADH